VQGPARREYREDRAVQAAGRLGRLLARRREAPALQRIYGTVWPTQEELDAYLWRREEAKKRDHRRLGVQLDLFSFHDVSPGSAFWHPKGQRIWRTLEGAMRELQIRRGYQEVSTPIVVSEKLWRQSGHWDLYRDNMFLVESEGQTFSLKPMNCPESTFIYRSHLRSYRDLPLRFSEFGRLHRNERSGTLSGLTRVRQFIQDDAHLYVRPDQLTDEIVALLGEVREAYGWFGLEPRFTFATKPDKAIGDPALWERAERLTREAFAAADISYELKPKDGTFYAPKIDIYIDDALGREWQMATIQIDLTMLPERFDLTYIDEEGKPQRPIAIHRAIYGSLERFIGILIEHFGGALPLWVAPVQAVVIPIADRHVDAARELAGVLGARGLRVEVDDSSNRMQYKIRTAQEQKVPYMVVLGDREIEARTASPRTRSGEQQPPETWESLADRLASEAAARGVD
jgi:threonyl-tRNA synthetase